VDCWESVRGSVEKKKTICLRAMPILGGGNYPGSRMIGEKFSKRRMEKGGGKKDRGGGSCFKEGVAGWGGLEGARKRGGGEKIGRVSPESSY